MRSPAPWLLLPLLLWLPLAGCRNPDQQGARLLREADEALSRKEWDTAFARAHEAAALSGLSAPLAAQARQREEQARSELQAKNNYARFVGAVDKDPDTAVAAYRDLPTASSYRAEGKEAYEGVRPRFVSDHLDKARAAHDNHRCADATTELRRVLEVDPGNAQALALQKQPCAAKKDE